MLKIVSDFGIGKIRVLKLDGEMPKTRYSKYVIDGKEYDIVPMYDTINCIAVEAKESLSGKTVTFK